MIYKFNYCHYKSPDDEVYDDILGWKKNYNKVMQATDGSGVAHDIMEHFYKDSGSKRTAIKEEFEALGGYFYCRGRQGYHSIMGCENDITSILWSIYRDYYRYNDFHLPLLGESRFRHNKNIKDLFQQIYEKFWDYVYSDLDIDPDDNEEQCIQENLDMVNNFFDSFKYYFTLGYRKSYKRFYRVETVLLFESIRKSVDSLKKNKKKDSLMIRLILSKGYFCLYKNKKLICEKYV